MPDDGPPPIPRAHEPDKIVPPRKSLWGRVGEWIEWLYAGVTVLLLVLSNSFVLLALLIGQVVCWTVGWETAGWVFGIAVIASFCFSIGRFLGTCEENARQERLRQGFLE